MNENDSVQLIKYVFDVIPSIVFVVDEDVRIQEYNAAAAEFLLVERASILKHRGGEVLHCLHSNDVPDGCGRGAACKGCVIRHSVSKAFDGNCIVRHRGKLQILRDRQVVEIYALITARQFHYDGRMLVLLVIEDISEIAELHRLIPICSQCLKIRDDKKSWSRIEAYFKDNWDVDFTHSLCPECYAAAMAQLDAEVKDLK